MFIESNNVVTMLIVIIKLNNCSDCTLANQLMQNSKYHISFSNY